MVCIGLKEKPYVNLLQPFFLFRQKYDNYASTSLRSLNKTIKNSVAQLGAYTKWEANCFRCWHISVNFDPNNENPNKKQI